MKAVIYHADTFLADKFPKDTYKNITLGLKENLNSFNIPLIHITTTGHEGWGDENYFYDGDPRETVYNREKFFLEFLKTCPFKIDILFLDGWDKGTPDYAEQHLEAFKSSTDKLSDTHLILIDDTDYLTEDGGKDKLLSPYLMENNYSMLFNGRQTLFINTVI